MKVCLDAGHYGKYNRSPVLPSYYESDMTWKLHNFLADELKKYGIEVVKTRPNQAIDLELTARGRKSAGCDLFISVHSNASSQSSAKLGGNGTAKKIMDEVADLPMRKDD